MNWKRGLAAVLVAGLTWVAGAQEAKKAETGAPVVDPAPIRQLLEKGQFAEALAADEAALQKDPASVDLQACKIDALLGLGRPMDALRVAVPLAGQHADRPDLRYRVGRCAHDAGMYPQAIQAWSALYGNPDRDWAGLAYRQSARTLMILGRKAEALQLVAQGLARWPEPPVALLKYSLEVNPDVADGIKHADQLMALDPANKAEYQSIKQIFLAAGEGRLCQESTQAGPITVKLKEKSETRSMSGLYWGSMDSGTVELTTSSRVVVAATLNGTKERWMLLDSGSDTVLVSKTVVKELGLQPVSAASYIGIGYEGVKNSSWVLLKNLAVGDFSVKNVPAMVIEGNDDFWKENGGILPLSLFSSHGVLYDRRKGKVTLYPSGTKPEEALPGGSYSVKSLWYSGKPFVEVKVQDRAGLNFLLDTGGYTTIIAGQYAQELGVRVNRAAESKASMGLSGTALSGQANDVTLWLGPARFKLSPCQVMEVYQGDAKTYGNLGRNVLDQFLIYFDYSSNVVAFKAYDK